MQEKCSKEQMISLADAAKSISKDKNRELTRKLARRSLVVN
jgi:hypothetical protein